jgi:integrase
MKTITQTEINNYLELKDKLWTNATYKSERARLMSNIDYLNMKPHDAYVALKAKGVAPYTIKTLFIRFASFFKVVHPKDTAFSQFLAENPQLFRNVYTRERAPCTFEEAKELIEKLPFDSRYMANYMLKSGLRISEMYQVRVDQDGSLYVVGKGGKRRKVYMKETPKHLVAKHEFAAELKKIGLKPHTLRKLLATELFKRDFKAQELCSIMGWSKLETALSYLQNRNESAIMSAMGDL